MLRIAELDDGTVVGWVLLGLAGPNDADAAWIYNIEIASEHRGHGYGRALLAAAETETVTMRKAVIGD